VITAEDPRTEDLDEIMGQIEAGCLQVGRVRDKDYFLIGDRAKAIEFAVTSAGPGDLVLLAGKGHERSLCIGEVEHPWSEHEAVAAALVRRRAIGAAGIGEETRA
jgi:UDP-N-acetylmuramoyl-L-alanyl-D-glutamate--2,6-diaminopimelate ligase